MAEKPHEDDIYRLPPMPGSTPKKPLILDQKLILQGLLKLVNKHKFSTGELTVFLALRSKPEMLIYENLTQHLDKLSTAQIDQILRDLQVKGYILLQSQGTTITRISFTDKGNKAITDSK